jgi:hypothetical protein
VNVTLRPLHLVSGWSRSRSECFDRAAKRTPNFLVPSRVTLLTSDLCWVSCLQLPTQNCQNRTSWFCSLIPSAESSERASGSGLTSVASRPLAPRYCRQNYQGTSLLAMALWFIARRTEVKSRRWTFKHWYLPEFCLDPVRTAQ